MKTLTLLQTSDLHAHIQAWNYFSGQGSEHGLAKIATLVRRERQLNPHATLLLDGGDTIQGSPLGSYYATIPTQTHPMAVVMNALDYTSMTLGNHDFNFGQTVLHRFMKVTYFPVLSANIRSSDGGEAFQPYALRQVDGIPVGILGLTTPRIDHWERADHIVGLRFDPVIETAHYYVPLLRDLGAAVIVVVLHSGPERMPNQRQPQDWLSDYHDWPMGHQLPEENQALQLAEQVAGIDVLFTGHTHQAIPALPIGHTLMVQPGHWGSHLAKVNLHLEEQADHTWRIVHKDSCLFSVEGIPADAELLRLAEPFHQAVLSYLAQPIGRSPRAFPSGAKARLWHSPIPHLINQAQIAAAQAAGWSVQISVASLNSDSGGIPAGLVSLQDVFSIVVYDNHLCVLEITGEMLRQALEKTAEYFQQMDPAQLPAQPEAAKAPLARHYNWDLYTGITYTLDLTQPIGHRLRHLSLDGEAIFPNQKLRVALNHYRAVGGSGFSMFRQGQLLWQSDETIREQVVRYIQEQPELDPNQLGLANLTLIPDLHRHFNALQSDPLTSVTLAGSR
ncbi:MAG: 5'-nucleotidase C-terminal domain-containing protein [Cyanobacteriota bacterium]|nr:5'-nucleotidase C-terminal domain-containing protein [Cyanobacteriota bacterium]